MYPHLPPPLHSPPHPHARPFAEMPDFVANNLLFSFGDQQIVQERLSGLIRSLEEYVVMDRLCLLFCRFSRLLVRLACNLLCLWVAAVPCCAPVPSTAAAAADDLNVMQGTRACMAWGAPASLNTAGLLLPPPPRSWPCRSPYPWLRCPPCCEPSPWP